MRNLPTVEAIEISKSCGDTSPVVYSELFLDVIFITEKTLGKRGKRSKSYLIIIYQKQNIIGKCYPKRN